MAKHTHCTVCGKGFGFFGVVDSGNGVCYGCDADERAKHRDDDLAAFSEKENARLAALDGMIVTTETLVVDYDVKARLGVVGADVAFGQGPFKDLAVGLSNAFGGRSETMRKMMNETRATALQELKLEAHALGANAIIGVTFTVSAIGANGSMTLMCATGTAVVLAAR